MQSMLLLLESLTREGLKACVLLSQAGAGQSADTRREWANAVLEALRTQSKLPGQASLPPPSPEKPPAGNPGTPSSGAQNPSTSGSGGGQNPGMLPDVIWLWDYIP